MCNCWYWPWNIAARSRDVGIGKGSLSSCTALLYWSERLSWKRWETCGMETYVLKGNSGNLIEVTWWPWCTCLKWGVRAHCVTYTCQYHMLPLITATFPVHSVIFVWTSNPEQETCIYNVLFEYGAFVTSVLVDLLKHI